MQKRRVGKLAMPSRLKNTPTFNKVALGLFLLAFMGIGYSVFFTQAANLSIILQSYATGFTRPVAIANSGVSGDGRLFIAQQAGQIKIIRSDGAVVATPFLDITSKVNSNGNERGLLGLAFHPSYASNGYFFVTYTNSAGSLVVSRYTKNSANPDLADPNSERIIITVAHPTYQNHNGGHVAFGPDGYLYIGTGDGGSGGDPGNNGQNKNSLLGKLLRLDINNGNPYSIPSTNPFVGQSNVRTEIWSYGLRNPWRFSFDRQTGDMFIADVGQGAWEEVNVQTANGTGGQNYGWRCYEGYATFNTSGCGQASNYIQPVTVYDHSNGRCSLTGGYRYRGSAYPSMNGYYFFADYCNGQLFSMTPGSSNTWTQEVQGQYSVNPSTFGEDINGELYLASLSNGVIYRLQTTTSSSDTTPPTVNLTAPANNASLSGTVAINATATDNVSVAKVDFIIDGAITNTDTASPYSYNWNTTAAINGAHTIVARATDGSGNTRNSTTINVTTNNTSPLPSPWQGRDVGAVAAPGSAAYGSGVFTIQGSGSDIWGTADEFYFVSQTLNGDGRITARVDSIQNTNAWAKAGLMIRETTNANSKHGVLFVTPSNGVGFRYRSTTNADSSGSATVSGTAPKWLRLERDGNNIIASYSNDGNSWSHLATQTISMNASVSIGMAVSSVADGVLAEAVFSNVAVGVGVPSIDITNPGHSDTFTGVNQVTTDVSDDIEVTRVEFYVDNTLVNTDTSAPFGFSWDTTPLANTTHTLTALAYDASGNVGTHTHIVTTQNSSQKPGDINGDQQVDVIDLSILLSNWATTNPNCDLNKNGTVDIFDLSILLSNYGS